MLEHISCAVCDSQNYKPIFQKQSFRLVRCENCGLVYVNPRLSDKDLNQTYTQEYYNEELLLKVSSDPMTQKRAEERLNELAKHIKHDDINKNNISLLDVGCGLGSFLHLASKKGWRCIGVDPSIKGADFVRSKVGVEVRCGYLDEISLPSRSFDCVTLFHVIEHEPNPKALLSEIRRILRPKTGLLAIETPNFNSLRRLILESKWGYIHPKDHIIYFAPDTIKRLLKDVGFTEIFFGKPRLVRLRGDMISKMKYHIRKPFTEALVRLNLGIVLRLYARWESG